MKAAIKTDRRDLQSVVANVPFLCRLMTSRVFPERRNEHSQIDATIGDLLGFTLICTNHQRLADHQNSHKDIIGGWFEVEQTVEYEIQHFTIWR